MLGWFHLMFLENKIVERVLGGMGAVTKLVVRIFFGDDEDGFSFSRTGVNVSYRGTPHYTVYRRCNGQSLRQRFGVFCKFPRGLPSYKSFRHRFVFTGNALHRRSTGVNSNECRRCPNWSSLQGDVASHCLRDREHVSGPSYSTGAFEAFVFGQACWCLCVGLGFSVH